MDCTAIASSSASAQDVALAKWRSRMLYQLDHKLRNQLPSHSSASALQSALLSIERAIVGFYHRSRIKQPPHQLLPLLSLPSLASLAAEPHQPVYADLDQHCNPLVFHKQRETTAHAFAAAASTPSQPLPALLQPRPLLLVGRLAHNAADATRLVLIDDTASIPCHIVHGDASLLGRIVLIVRFNVVWPSAGRTAGDGGGAGGGGGLGMLEVDGRDAVGLDEEKAVDWSALRPLPLHRMHGTQIRKLFKSSKSPSTTSQPPALSISSSLSSTTSSSSSSSSLSSSSTSRSGRVHHLRGHVSAISPIIQQGGQHFFFVDLRHQPSDDTPPANHPTVASPLPSSGSTFILFQGATVLCWYPVLHVDGEYLFSQLRPKAFKMADGRVKLLFVFMSVSTTSTVSSLQSAGVPRVFSAASCQLPDFATLQATDLPALEQPLPVSDVCKGSHTVDYIGTITKHVCVGVYELDHNATNNLNKPSIPPSSTTPAILSRPPPSLRLFITHYDPIVQDGLLVRPGCVVRLHHVHVLVHGGRFLGFGCCSRSHVAVVQLSPFAEVCKPYDAASGSALTAHLSRLTLSDAALYLSVMESLLHKWGRRVKADLLGDGQPNTGLIHRLLSAHINPHHQPNIYAEVMEHTSCTSALPGSTAAAGSPMFPSYSALFQLPAVVSAYEGLCQRIANTDHSATAWHAACIPSERLLPAGWFVTGYFSASSLSTHPRTFSIPSPSNTVCVAGVSRPPVSSVCTGLQLRESLRDKAAAIECDVRGVVSGEHCGVLYHVQSFQLVLETVPPALSSASGPLPPAASAATTAHSIVAYLSFSIADAVPLIARVPRPQPTSVFTSQPTHATVLFYIIQKKARTSRAVAPSSSLFVVPHHDLPASCFASPSSTASHGQECTLQGVLVSSCLQSLASVLIHLRPPLLALSSIVHVGAVVGLSSCRPLLNTPSLDVSEVYETTETCTLRIDQSTAAREWQQAVHSLLPSVHTFPQLLTVDMDEWLDSDGGAKSALFSFCGIIIDKQVRAEGFHQTRRLLRARRSNSAPQTLHSSLFPSVHDSCALESTLPQSLSGKMYLRVRDESCSHVVDVYVPLGQRTYPAGLLVGAVVAMSGAVRKLSPSWKIYVECAATTDIRILSPPLPPSTAPSFAFSPTVPPPPQSLPSSPLSSFTPCPVVVSQLVHRVRCRVHAIKRLSFAIHCLRCALPLPPANERRQHKSPCGAGGCTRIEFRASGYVQVDDGTHTAVVVAEGERLVWRMLGLTRHEWDEVKKYVGRWGQLQYDASQQQQQRQEPDSRWVNRRPRDEGQRQGEAAMDEDDAAGSQRRSEADEPDIGEMQRERLFSLFRTKPRLRLVVLLCQQLISAKDIDAFMDRRQRQQEERVPQWTEGGRVSAAAQCGRQGVGCVVGVGCAA